MLGDRLIRSRKAEARVPKQIPVARAEGRTRNPVANRNRTEGRARLNWSAPCGGAANAPPLDRPRPARWNSAPSPPTAENGMMPQTAFAEILDTARQRHGAGAIDARLPQPKSAAELAAMPDDRYL